MGRGASGPWTAEAGEVGHEVLATGGWRKSSRFSVFGTRCRLTPQRPCNSVQNASVATGSVDPTASIAAERSRYSCPVPVLMFGRPCRGTARRPYSSALKPLARFFVVVRGARA